MYLKSAIPSPAPAYSFDFSGHNYLLIQDRPEGHGCNYYYQLNCDGEPIQRYEVIPRRKGAILFFLVALCVVAAFPVAVGEISERFIGIRAQEWSFAVELSVITAGVISAIATYLGLVGRLTIKNLMGPDLKV